MANETPSRPPPLMANAIKNFHFDFPHPSLTASFLVSQSDKIVRHKAKHIFKGRSCKRKHTDTIGATRALSPRNLKVDTFHPHVVATR